MTAFVENSSLFAAPAADAADPLGLGKPPGEARVVVAMSGGVDSSVVAGLVKAMG